MKNILKPDLYHGQNKKTDFFEGWYFKVADKTGKAVFAFIPGISKARNPKYHHSFIQILDGTDRTYNYIRGQEKEFEYEENKFDITVFGNRFSESFMELDLDNGEKSVSGKLEFQNIKKWPEKKLRPGSMGYYNYLTFMECYSQVTVMDAEIKGSLKVDGRTIDFDGGKVYIEKNWGKEFPRSWIWVQSNSFKDREVSFTCSVGRVPLGPVTFSGFLVGLYIGKDFYEFTTMNRAKIEINRKERDVELKFKRKDLELVVSTESDLYDFILSMGPREGEMIPLVNECLNGKVKLKLIDKKKDKVIYEGKGDATGIEYGGELMF
jgi:tocopherol cyclase